MLLHTILTIPIYFSHLDIFKAVHEGHINRSKIVFLSFFTLMDHQAPRDWLHNMFTLALDVEVLSQAQQLQYLLRKLSPVDIVASEGK